MRYEVIATKDVPSKDLEWDGESKRIIAVGDGREKYVLRPNDVVTGTYDVLPSGTDTPSW